MECLNFKTTSNFILLCNKLSIQKYQIFNSLGEKYLVIEELILLLGASSKQSSFIIKD